MQTHTCTVKFLTPAFLGNAEQSGQWRTPPFKALLRQWWRVAVASEYKYNVDKLREEEHKLFGTVEGKARKSAVRIRLDKWSDGTLTAAPNIGQVSLGKNGLPAALYSGYGPVVAGPRLKAHAAIQAGDHAELRLAYEANPALEVALALMDRFGTLGGRSRNGWGSFAMESMTSDTPVPLVPWRDALKLDWAHGIGRDERGPLIWESQPMKRWEDAMRLLAQTRAEMRRAVSDRLLLAYPSTKGSMRGWTNNDRVPHSLRFKVRAQGVQFVATVFHVPCRPSNALWQKLPSSKQHELPECFAQAHSYLDHNAHFSRAQA